MTNFQGCEKKTVLLTKRFFTEHFYRDLFQLNEIYGPMDKKKKKTVGDYTLVIRKVQYEYIEKSK